MRFDFSVEIAANAVKVSEVLEAVEPNRETGKLDASVVTAGAVLKMLEG